MSLFSKASLIFEDDYTYYAAEPASVSRIQKADIDSIKAVRQDNAGRLIRGLLNNDYDWLTLPVKVIQKDDCPLFVPVLIKPELRDMVKNKLIEQRIYCPIHWPLSGSHDFGNAMKDVYTTELSLVCDQRYGLSDMDKLLEVLQGIGDTI